MDRITLIIRDTMDKWRVEKFEKVKCGILVNIVDFAFLHVF